MIVLVLFVKYNAGVSQSFSIKGADRRLIIDLNSPSLLLCRIVERQLPTTLTLRRSEPQSHQMSPWCRWCMIFICRTGVKHLDPRLSVQYHNSKKTGSKLRQRPMRCLLLTYFFGENGFRGTCISKRSSKKLRLTCSLLRNLELGCQQFLTSCLRGQTKEGGSFGMCTSCRKISNR